MGLNWIYSPYSLADKSIYWVLIVPFLFLNQFKGARIEGTVRTPINFTAIHLQIVLLFVNYPFSLFFSLKFWNLQLFACWVAICAENRMSHHLSRSSSHRHSRRSRTYFTISLFDYIGTLIIIIIRDTMGILLSMFPIFQEYPLVITAHITVAKTTLGHVLERHTNMVIDIGWEWFIWSDYSHRAMSRRRDGHSYSQKSSHKSFNDDSERDDSIGHFLGGKGDIIGNKCEISCCFWVSDRIVSELGTGTFAKAFEVVNMETNEKCAVKVVRSIPRYLLPLFFHLAIVDMPRLKQKLLQI